MPPVVALWGGIRVVLSVARTETEGDTGRQQIAAVADATDKEKERQNGRKGTQLCSGVPL